MSVPPDPTTTAAPSARRLVLVHYHLFKNAGTSVDAMLRVNFGERWGEREFEGRAARGGARAVRDHLLAHPELAALSSHTAPLPPPELPGADVFPIIFLRHPLLRLRSAYGFERTQGADTLGARLAREHDFAGYARALLDTPDHRQARDFQTHRLAAGTSGVAPEINRAVRTLARLPFVGLVEAYDASIERLGALLAPRIPGFRPLVVRENAASARDAPVRRRVRAVEEELGPDLAAELARANTGDFRLWRRVRATYLAPDGPASA